MSKYPVDAKRFDETGRNIEYQNSTIRKWLNEDFYNKVFSDNMKKMIKSIRFNDFEDKVFLLSADDIYKYFNRHMEINNNVSDMMDTNPLDVRKLLSDSKTFEYIKPSVIKEPFNGKWNDFHQGFLLRDNGECNYLVKYIDNDGKINNDGILTDMPYMPIRPAIYVSDKDIDITIDNNNESYSLLKDTIHENEIDDIESIFIGRCEQDGVISNGKEDIEWDIIGCEGNDVLLLSKYILDVGKINDCNKICKYENSMLRKKLLNMYNEYFDDKEKELLIERNNINYSSILDGENGSDITKEKLFVLSIDDIRKFFGDTDKPYGLLKSENTYYLNTRTDIQRLSNDLYLDNNYFLRSVGSVDAWFPEIDLGLRLPLTFNGICFTGLVYKDFYDSIFWSNVDKNGQVGYVKINVFNKYLDYDDYQNSPWLNPSIIFDESYINGIRPCIKVNIFKLKEYINSKRNINPYLHKEIKKSSSYNLDEIEKVDILKNNEDYITFDSIDTINFGKYVSKVDKAEINLEWFVLYKDNDKSLLLSKYLIYEDSFDYNEVWETSNIRKVLNDSFFNNSFTDIEKDKILTTTIKPKSDNSKETFDKVFIPYKELINKYILDSDMNNEIYLQKFNRLKVSKYLKDYIEYNNIINGTNFSYYDFSRYCLLDKNENQSLNTFVNINGQIYYDDFISCGIRPAIWVKID